MGEEAAALARDRVDAGGVVDVAREFAEPRRYGIDRLSVEFDGIDVACTCKQRREDVATPPAPMIATLRGGRS